MENREFENKGIRLKLIQIFAVGSGLVLLGVGSIIFLRPHGMMIGIALFALSFIVEASLAFRAFFHADCPQCARPMKRTSSDKGEYPCHVCGVNWVMETQS